jgi:hypothetical protein
MDDQGISTAMLATAIIEIEVSYGKLIIDDPEFTFNPNGKHTPSELDSFATMILKADIKGGSSTLKGDAPILFAEHLKTRYKREIYNRLGIPDPSIQQGMYWRTHPEGRKINTEEARKRSGASFFR